MKIIDNVIDTACGWLRRKACAQLHIPHMEIWLTLDFYDEHGNLTKHMRQRAKSWVRNAYNTFMQGLSSLNYSDATFGGGLMSLKRTSGSVIGGYPIIILQSFTAPGESNAYGIVVGTGTTAWSFENYCLAAIIAPGNSAGQLFSPAGYGGGAVYTAGTKTWKASYTRVFNNNSGGNITLGEIGLIGHMYPYYVTQSQHVLYSRDVLPVTETLYDKAQLKITYDISITFPA